MIEIDKNNKTLLVDSIQNGKKGVVAKIIRGILYDVYKSTDNKEIKNG